MIKIKNQNNKMSKKNSNNNNLNDITLRTLYTNIKTNLQHSMLLCMTDLWRYINLHTKYFFNDETIAIPKTTYDYNEQQIKIL